MTPPAEPIALRVLASAWFCWLVFFAALVVATHVLSYAETRDLTPDAPPFKSATPYAYVATNDTGETFVALPFSKLPDIGSASPDVQARRLRPDLHHPPALTTAWTTASPTLAFRLIDADATSAVIEQRETDPDGDWTVWNRYRVADGRITPLTSRLLSFDYMLGAVPWAAGVGVAVELVGRMLRWRWRRRHAAGRVH